MHDELSATTYSTIGRVDASPAQDGMIRKEAFLNDNCLTELRRIIESSEILKEDDQVFRRQLHFWGCPDSHLLPLRSCWRALHLRLTLVR
jgi:hypothetical protein